MTNQRARQTQNPENRQEVNNQNVGQKVTAIKQRQYQRQAQNGRGQATKQGHTCELTTN